MFFGKRLSRRVIGFSALLALLSGKTAQASKWNMPEGATAISHKVYALHMMAFWVCVAIGVVVFGIMLYSLFAHRRSKNPVPAHFHESTTIEILWTIAPFIVLIGMAIPAARTLIEMYDTRNADLTIKITGFQWRWQYDYVDSGVSFISSLAADSNEARELHSGIDPGSVPNYLLAVDHNLVLPVGKKIRFLVTSDDVIHGWWVPDLAVKRDAIPGFINDVWAKIDTPGIYRGQCTVLCGRDHGFMPIVVEAKTQDDFDAWVKAQGGKPQAEQAVASAQAPPLPPQIQAADSPAVESAAPPPTATAAPAKPMAKDDLVKAGEKVYQANCQACHQATGQGLPPTFPSLIGDKVVNGTPEGHIEQILKGKNAMPPFAQLSDEDIAAVATYERSSWGNHAPEVQPAQVAAQRSK